MKSVRSFVLASLFAGPTFLSYAIPVLVLVVAAVVGVVCSGTLDADREAIAEDRQIIHDLPILAPNITIPCEVVRAIDGDTVVLRPTVTFHGRLLNCWAQDGTEGDAKAKEWIDQYRGRRVMVTIPFPGGDLSHAQTFNRFLVDITGPGGVNFSRELVRLNLATEKKPKSGD